MDCNSSGKTMDRIWTGATWDAEGVNCVSDLRLAEKLARAQVSSSWKSIHAGARHVMFDEACARTVTCFVCSSIREKTLGFSLE